MIVIYFSADRLIMVQRHNLQHSWAWYYPTCSMELSKVARGEASLADIHRYRSCWVASSRYQPGYVTAMLSREGSILYH